MGFSYRLVIVLLACLWASPCLSLTLSGNGSISNNNSGNISNNNGSNNYNNGSNNYNNGSNNNISNNSRNSTPHTLHYFDNSHSHSSTIRKKITVLAAGG